MAADFDALRTFDLLDGESLAGFELRAQLTPAGSAGELAATVEFLVRVGSQPSPNGDAPRVRDYTTQRDAEVAHWPAESACARGELPVAADQTLFELTPRQIAQMLAMPRTLRWDDGATTTLRLNVTGMGTACLADLNPEWLSPIEWPPIVPEDPAVFGVMVDIAIATDDGRFQSDASVMLQYQARKTGGLERAWFQHVAKLAPGDPGGWAADAADHGSQRATRLQVSVPSSEGSSMLLLHGPPAAASSCSAPSSMCPGLPPSLTTLLRGTIE